MVMEGSSRLKCSECVRQGRPCVNLSWASLDRTREEYRKKVEADEEELQRVLSRLLRNKKILRQAEERAKKKAQCLMSELDVNGELEAASSDDCPAASVGVAASPAMWETLALLDSYTAASSGLGESVVEAAGSS